MTITPPFLAHWPRALLAILCWAGAVRGAEIERIFEIVAPATATAGIKLELLVRLSTSARDGEQIAYFQAEASSDGGRTWKMFWAEDNLGTSATRHLYVTPSVGDPELRVRARVAYRGGLADAVDCTGAAIRWYETWATWAEPPARSVRISVKASGS